MRRYKAAASSTRRSQALLALLLGTTLGLAGCGSIDDALFGSDTDQGAAPVQDAANGPAPLSAGTLPGAAPSEGAMPQASGPISSGITPVTIEQGADTGTAVGHTVQSLRAQVASIQDRIHRRSAAARRSESVGFPVVAAISRSPRRASRRACSSARRVAILSSWRNGTRRKPRSMR